MQENKIQDYTIEGFIIPIIREDIKCYASVNAEMYLDNDELDPTGLYHVYLLHYRYGSCNFLLDQEIGTGKWFSKNAPPYVEADIIFEIGTEITFRKDTRENSN